MCLTCRLYIAPSGAQVCTCPEPTPSVDGQTRVELHTLALVGCFKEMPDGGRCLGRKRLCDSCRFIIQGAA